MIDHLIFQVLVSALLLKDLGLLSLSLEKLPMVLTFLIMNILCASKLVEH